MSMTQRIRAGIIAESYRHWVKQGQHVLDVGCGNGVVSQFLKDALILRLHGTDILDYRKTDIPFTQMREGHKLPFLDSSFDCVMFNDVLHHTDDIESLILEGKRVAKRILIFEDKKSWLLSIVDIVLNYFYSPKMPCPLNFKTSEEWHLLFLKLGLSCEAGEINYPFWYPFRHQVFCLRNVA